MKRFFLISVLFCSTLSSTPLWEDSFYEGRAIEFVKTIPSSRFYYFHGKQAIASLRDFIKSSTLSPYCWLDCKRINEGEGLPSFDPSTAKEVFTMYRKWLEEGSLESIKYCTYQLINIQKIYTPDFLLEVAGGEPQTPFKKLIVEWHNAKDDGDAVETIANNYSLEEMKEFSKKVLVLLNDWDVVGKQIEDGTVGDYFLKVAKVENTNALSWCSIL